MPLDVPTVQAKSSDVPHVTSHVLLNAVALKPSRRCVDPAVSGPLQGGTHQQSLLHRVGPGRHPDHAVTMVLHQGASLMNLAKPLLAPYLGWVRPPQRPPARCAPSSFGSLPLSAKSTSVYPTLACTHTARPGSANERDSRFPQKFPSTGMCTIVCGVNNPSGVTMMNIS